MKRAGCCPAKRGSPETPPTPPSPKASKIASCDRRIREKQPPAEKLGQRRFEVLSHPHLGLNLKIHQVYEEADLRRRCGDDQAKIRRLETALRKPSIFQEVDVVAAPALNLFMRWSLGHGQEVGHTPPPTTPPRGRVLRRLQTWKGPSMEELKTMPPSSRLHWMERLAASSDVHEDLLRIGVLETLIVPYLEESKQDANLELAVLALGLLVELPLAEIHFQKGLWPLLGALRERLPAVQVFIRQLCTRLRSRGRSFDGRASALSPVSLFQVRQNPSLSASPAKGRQRAAPPFMEVLSDEEIHFPRARSRSPSTSRPGILLKRVPGKG
ncbi:hypothetical protein AK812_SmicGene8269 [Symbiodinium microadriaticum]|uniref:Uncharacterized protein n=1 Tax=Symbiodinium microadriaticum TaxID=2951 RepID=A0A1Q9ELE2_SYMMI|nr:hypothetical protein AK812_SmicGene8269 [Symbiodinium microadriaticum]